MFELALYVAVTLLVPPANVVVVNLAFPPLSCAVPSTVFPKRTSPALRVWPSAT